MSLVRGKDKTAAYQTLYECLQGVLMMTSPFAPFLSDELYRNLNTVTGQRGEESIHLAMMPQPEESSIDAHLERRMERAEKIVILVRAMRMKSNLRVRQPLKRIILPIADEREREEVQRVAGIILDEVNVKAIEFVTDESGLVRKKVKPSFKSIGPKFGKGVQAVAARLKELTPAEIAGLEKTGSLTIAVAGTNVSVVREDVDVIREDIQGWLVESDGGLTVALDTELTDELLAEGSAREFVNRVQNLRKDAGFEVTDRIAIFYTASPGMQTTLEAMKEYITGETLAAEMTDGFREGEFASTIEINGEEIRVGIERRTRS
jgi:isoleucyl-tRNA synthetase